MKLLLITQVVDKEHPILGFFHRWIDEFAAQCEQVHVIGLQVGKYDLPDNVTVHSLGKETAEDRFTYLIRFYRYIWQLRYEYDTVFVHMNQLYVLLGAIYWRAWGKRIGLWYAHGSVSVSLRLATLFTHNIFTSTKEGFRLSSPKTKIVGQGIDLALFNGANRSKTSRLELVTVGRIAASKNIDTLLRACVQLEQRGVDFRFSIIGTSLTKQEEVYQTKMQQLVHELGLEDRIVWVGAVTQSQLPEYLQSADVFIHDGATNSLDKTLLEAILCGCIVVSSNPAYRAMTQDLAPAVLFRPNDYKQLASIMTVITANPNAHTTTNKQLQNHVQSNFSVESLVTGIVALY